MKSPAVLIASVLTLTIALSAAAAETPTPPEPAARPRIGLVLSGGGARGAAHIGVIRVLEELRIPVDVVTGTSMGSIIGGLYSLGRSPEDMRQAIEKIDWVDVFNDDAGREEYSYRRKQDDFQFLTKLRLGFKDGSFFVPTGLIQGQKLDFWLRALTLTESGSGDFSSLTLPFKAIATDAETGEAVLLEHGDVATAMRASMSIPGAFAPVDLDGRRLVDGGTANNLPVDIAQAMGADVIIAIDISTPLLRTHELSSMLDISSQMIGIPIQQNQAAQIARLDEDDVLLRPELGAIGAASFTRLPEAIEIGERTAREHADTLRKLSLPEDEYRAWQQQQRQPAPKLPVVDRISLENDSRLDDALLRALIRTEVGEPLDLDRLARDLGRVHGTDAFDLVRFDLVAVDRAPGAGEGESGSELVIRASKRARGINHLRIGLNLSSNLSNDSSFSVAVNHVAYPLDRWGREWRSRFEIGHTLAAGSEIYQPLGSSERFFVTPSVEFERTELAVYDTRPPADRRELASYDTNDLIVGLQSGVNLGNVARIQGGLGYLLAESKLDQGDRTSQGISLPPDTRVDGGVALFEVNLDTLDNTHFPNHGSIATISGLFLEDSLGWEDSSRRLEVGWRGFRTWNGNTLGLGVEYETLLSGSLGGGALGGFSNLSGFPRDSILGESTVYGSVTAYRRIGSPVLFAWDFPIYLGAIAEVGSAWSGDRDDIPPGVDPLLWSAGSFVGAETPLGPLYLAYAYGEGGSHQGYLFLGQPF